MYKRIMYTYYVALCICVCTKNERKTFFLIISHIGPLISSLAISTLVVLVRFYPMSGAFLFSHTFLCQHLICAAATRCLFSLWLLLPLPLSQRLLLLTVYEILVYVFKKRINIYFVQIIQSFVLVLNHVLLFASI